MMITRGKVAISRILEHVTAQEKHCTIKITLARCKNAFWPAATLLPCHAFSTDACKARPYEKVSAQGRSDLSILLIASKLAVADVSDWPPERKVTPVKID